MDLMLLPTALLIDDFPKVTVYGCDFRNELCQMYNAISRLGLWDQFRAFIPDPKDGYTFSSDPVIEQICKSPEVDQCGHSGATQALCFRHMQSIALLGWDEYIKRL